ncbi:60 kDa chaperonin [Candidatus Nitrosocosmicus oleophilus]|uniref:60 kDa chaperonin n=1 Tax=Candidatus Nitrosocosmicus oleophilus TaxID=1353260 RepID=A0A654LWL2_9ARCH|nr:thermosome subunit alpha [Candidatus Nitrosocosmicus oleophilus]ALI35595.1 60 kDa chaperonin [Candidatus Nitrosocosmicus oleophilus]
MSHTKLIPNDTQRTSGKEVRSYNIHAAQLIKSLIESCYGPLGNEKIYIDIIGESTCTKDGATFLRKIDVQHPAAKVLIDATNTVDNEVGDGTLTTAIIATTLLEKAQEMLAMDIYPSTIVNGYDKGLQCSLETLRNIARKVSSKDMAIIEKLARTCLGTKVRLSSDPQSELNNILEITVNAINTVYSNNNYLLEADDIKIEEKIGNLGESILIDGVLIDKSIDSDLMPRFVKNARILLLDEDLQTRTTKTESQLSINSPEHMYLFRKEENNITRDKIQIIIDSGINVVINRKGIDLVAQDLLAKFGIISVKRVKENDLHWLEKATGGNLIKELDVGNIQSNVGYAKNVYEKKIGTDKMIFVEGCNNPKTVSILIRANSKMMLDEYHRAIQSTITSLSRFVQHPSIVIGGGSCEALMAQQVRKRANTIEGMEQIVLLKFSEALEEIPLILAKNSGLNLMDAFIQLRLNLSQNFNTNKVKWFGLDSDERKISQLDWDIIEPTIVKEQVLNTAVEVSRLLINIDDIIIKKPLMNTHTHEDGTEHSHAGGDKKHDHYFDRLGKQQRPQHHYY